MASIVSVEQIKGLAAGSTPNTITIPSGQTLHAPGHIIQVVTVEHGTYVQTTGSSFADTGLQATITPKLAASHILIICNVQAGKSGVNGFEPACRILRVSDSAMIGAEGQRWVYSRIEDNSSNMHASGMTTITRKDTSHNSTSAQTYKFQHRIISGGGTLRHNDYSTGTGPDQSTMILMEISQ